MNLGKQLEEFYSRLDFNPISSNAIALYTILLQISRKTNYKEEFRVSNTILMGKTNINISALQRARAELIESGYIDYKKRT